MEYFVSAQGSRSRFLRTNGRVSHGLTICTITDASTGGAKNNAFCAPPGNSTSRMPAQIAVATTLCMLNRRARCSSVNFHQRKAKNTSAK